MGIRNILKFGDETLSLKCREVKLFDEKLAALLDDMSETMYRENGVGLAAPQVGILRRVCVVDVDIDLNGEDNRDGSQIVEFINPVIVKQVGTQREVEGCLSSPGLWGYVTRPDFIVVDYFDRFGNKQELEAEGLAAITICHEIDHLDGIIFTDVSDELVEDPPDRMKRRAAMRAPTSRKKYEKFHKKRQEIENL